jgi:hypothetical protein
MTVFYRIGAALLLGLLIGGGAVGVSAQLRQTPPADSGPVSVYVVTDNKATGLYHHRDCP